MLRKIAQINQITQIALTMHWIYLRNCAIRFDPTSTYPFFIDFPNNSLNDYFAASSQNLFALDVE